MPDASSSIGVQRDLPVRNGNTLRRFLVLQLKSGQLQGGTVRADIFRTISDMNPLAPPSPTFTVKRLMTSPATAPRFSLELTKEQVTELAALATDPSVPSGTSRQRTGMRTLYWTCSYEDDTGDRRTLYYGKLQILLGASGG